MPHVTEEIWSQFHDGRLILGPWPEPARRRRSRGGGGDGAGAERRGDVPAQRRRCVELEGEEKRIFDAVVQARAARGGRRRRGRGRAGAAARRRSPAPRGCSRTSASSQNAPPDVVEAEREKLERYRRELEALGG